MTLLLVKPETLFITPTEILEAIARPDDSAADTGKLLTAAMGLLRDPLLVNHPFAHRAEA